MVPTNWPHKLRSLVLNLVWSDNAVTWAKNMVDKLLSKLMETSLSTDCLNCCTARNKQPLSCRWDFQKLFDRKMVCFNSNFTKVCSFRCNWQVHIGSGKDQSGDKPVPGAILVLRRQMASLGHNEWDRDIISTNSTNIIQARTFIWIRTSYLVIVWYSVGPYCYDKTSIKTTQPFTENKSYSVT